MFEDGYIGIGVLPEGEELLVGSAGAGSALPYSVCGEGTFDPSEVYPYDTNYRWMGSIAQDSAGDLGLEYSESGSSIDPSIAVTGVEPGQNGKDDCTFWYTNENSTTLNLLGVYNIFWGTVIGSFHMGHCTSSNSP